MHGFLQFMANGWLTYGNTLLTYVFWALIGYVVLLPVLFVQAAYNAARIGNLYDIRGRYRHEKQQYRRETKFYGLVITLIVLLLFAL